MVGRPLDQAVDELVVDRLLDDQPGAGRADLARVQEDRGEREVEGDLEVGVSEHHVGVLAAELERHPLHRPGGGRHQPPAGLQTAGEGDEVDPGIGRQGCAGGRAGAEDEVADAGRQPGLGQQPHQVDRGVRRQLAGLEDEGVAGREAGGDLPGDLEERVVPRRDQRADADRLVHDPADDVGVAGVDHPAGVLGRDPAVVAEDRRPRRRCRSGSRPGACRCRATPSGPGPRRRARAGRRAVSSRSPRSRADVSGHGPSWKARVRRGDRGLGVLGAGLVDLGDQAAVGRTADLAACSTPRAHPRAVEVELGHSAPTPRTTTQLRITQPIACRATGSLSRGWSQVTAAVKGKRPAVVTQR